MLNLPNPYNDELCGSEQLFNSNSEPCDPCTPESNQVRWADIIDKPACFPTCNPEVLGVTSLNGFTGIVTLGIGSTGTNFNIVNSAGTITLNLPIANATKTGKLSSTDWNTFNNKQNAISLTTTGNSGPATFITNTLNIPNYTLAGLGGVGGTGTLNFLPKWTFTTSLVLGDSIIYDNGAGSIGIGTISPTTRLDVFTLGSTTTTIKARNGNGGILLSATSTAGTISTDWNSPLIFSPNSVERLRITTAGNVGIGVSSPTELLHVDGGATLKNILLKTTAAGIANSGYLFENGNGSMKFGGFNTTLGIGTTTTSGFDLFYNNTAVLTVDAAKIGINHSLPLSNLHIRPSSSGNNPTVTIEELFNNRSYNIYVTDTTGDLYIERLGATNGARLRLAWDSNFTFGSGLITGGVTHYDASGTLDGADYIVWAGHVSNSITLTLPALSTVEHGKTYIIKRISQHLVTVNKNGADPNFDFPHNGVTHVNLTDKEMVKIVAWKNQPPRGINYATSFWMILSN